MDLNNNLYHYTGAGALLSIVQRRQFWASQSNVMNDKDEGAALPQVLKWMCENPRAFLPTLESPNRKHLDALDVSLRAGQLFCVVSLSSHWRSLPMYRMYTPPAGGYVIGFPSAVVQTLGPLVQVNYSNAALWDWARSYAHEFLLRAAAVDSPDKTAEQICYELRSSTDLIPRRVSAALSFKSDEFSSEGEWRLLIPGGWESFRESREGNYVIPYRKVAIPNEAFEVVISNGPNRYPNLAEESKTLFSVAARKAGTLWNIGALSSGEYGFRP